MSPSGEQEEKGEEVSEEAVGNVEEEKEAQSDIIENENGDEIQSSSTTAEQQDNDLPSCPICLNHPTEECPTFAKTPCDHSFCLSCLEQVLNANADVAQWPPLRTQDSDAHLAAPTLGRCPICRSALSLFHVVDSVSGSLLYPQESSLATSPIANQVYIRYGRQDATNVGRYSFHFETSADEEDSYKRPYINFAKLQEQAPWYMANGDPVPRHKLFDAEGMHFHTQSRTFHAKLSFPSKFRGSHQWQVHLGFAKDYRFISSGVIVQHRNLRVQNVSADLSDEERARYEYPLDGKWTVVWYVEGGDETSSKKEERRTTITVAGNEYHQAGHAFYLNLEDGQPWFQWPKSRVTQRCENGIDLSKDPMGPPIDGRVVWTTNHPQYPRIYWIRQTVGLPAGPRTILFGNDPDRWLYQRLEEGSLPEEVIPKYHANTIWGNVFCKKLRLGSASYHFISPDQSYISYEHPCCRELPPLDDETPLPTRVYMRNIDFEESSRTLKATIEWERDFGISWNDNIRWKLDMQFDSEYLVILKGGIQCEWCHERRAKPRPKPAPPRHRPPPVAVHVPVIQEGQATPAPTERNEEWKMSGYGYDQLYMNAAMLDRFEDEVADVPADQPKYYRICKQVIRRLEAEGATERTRQMLEHVFRLASDETNTGNVLDYNIS